MKTVSSTRAFRYARGDLWIGFPGNLFQARGPCLLPLLKKNRELVDPKNELFRRQEGGPLVAVRAPTETEIYQQAVGNMERELYMRRAGGNERSEQGSAGGSRKELTEASQRHK
jgi:hypothetical protein